MEGRERHHAGGILGLLELHKEHGEAIEHDLLLAGYKWRWAGTGRLSWRDVWVIVRAAQPGSAIHRALSPDGKGWSENTAVLADLIDEIRALKYYVQAQVSRKRPKKPKPYPRPGVKPAHTETFGYAPMPIPELILKLGWENRPEVMQRV